MVKLVQYIDYYHDSYYYYHSIIVNTRGHFTVRDIVREWINRVDWECLLYQHRKIQSLSLPCRQRLPYPQPQSTGPESVTGTRNGTSEPVH